MTPPRIRVVTFDLDDTLWDVRPVLIEAERRTHHWLAEHAPAAPRLLENGGAQTLRAALVAAEPALVHQLSRLRTEVFRTAMLQAGHTEPRATELAERAFGVFFAARHEVVLFAGVMPLLRELRQQYRLGALSNGNADLRRLNCGPLFEFHFSAEQVGAPKPDPAMFQAALEHAQVAPHEVLHVGDSAEHDVLGAHRAGVRSVWVNALGAPFPDLPARPTAEVRSVLELPGILRSLHEEG